MTNAALLVLPLFAAACVADELPAEERPAPTTPIAFQAETAADGKLHIATGGAALVTTAEDTVGLSGDTSSGFAIEPVGAVWPNLEAPRYWVRAIGSGTGSFEIDTNRGIATGLVHSEEVTHIGLVPVGYELDGHSPFALDARRPVARLALYGATGTRLVDGTASLVDDQATVAAQTAWDTLELAHTAGTHHVHVVAGSLAEQDITVEVVDHIDRIETVQDGGLTCFHAYTGAYEVAAVIELAAPEPTAANCTRLAVTAAEL